MKKTTIFLLICLAGEGALAQNTESQEEVQQPQSLNEQFNQLKDNSETFKTYKVIKETELNAFWKTVQDSVGNKEQRLSEAQQLIEVQKKELTKLQEVIQEKDTQLQEKEHAGTHITVMGIDFLKDSYILINIVIISLLLIAMAILLYKFKDNNRIARKKSNDYERLDGEFENYKRNALEKQMKLRRDLQTARNRLDDIRST
ncbi:hypothetical protein JMN32_05975 [Fulvivirga sp. 29W222]|uniref:tRNA (Guanine-N1)-methyltransferase n=1 Tax=Fulvivirga marina TaxID=2494733 RepID=A0A937FWU2_9BACT|nr:hypothetical protein [Fulvivirga marina]MBL6445845.1 hypothetical protein [Fulvivirga marina]